MIVLICGLLRLVLWTPIELSTSSSSFSSLLFTSEQENDLVVFHGSKVRFILTIGLEGTGHHALSEVVRISPFVQKLKDQGRIYPSLIEQLGLQLFDDSTYNGLWNAHCKQPKSLQHYPYTSTNNRIRMPQATTTTTATIHNPSNAEGIETDSQGQQRRLQVSAASEPNVQNHLERVVETLVQIEQKAALDENDKQEQQISIPVNLWSIEDIDGMKNVGMVSYPSYKGACRNLNYPNLDLFYQACNTAKVDCQHVYIYRDPYAILKSTNRRNINPSLLGAIHLYTTMLQVIFAQLTTHGPYRTVGCWGILEEANHKDDNDDEKDHNGWKDELAELWGWKSPKDFRSAWNDVYRPPKAVTEEEKRSLAPPKFDPYMKSFYRAHKDVLNLCKTQMNTKRSG